MKLMFETMIDSENEVHINTRKSKHHATEFEIVGSKEKNKIHVTLMK
jgi:hypothetical protein